MMNITEKGRRRIAGVHFRTIGTIACGILCGSAWTHNSFDTSGNGMLMGPYFVRQVLLANLDQNTSAIGRAVSLIGTMTFDDSGKYTFTGQKTDTQSGGNAQAYSTTGTYKVSSSGMVQIQNPIDSEDTGELGGIGVVGPSAIVASSTEGHYNDVFTRYPQALAPQTTACKERTGWGLSIS